MDKDTSKRESPLAYVGPMLIGTSSAALANLKTHILDSHERAHKSVKRDGNGGGRSEARQFLEWLASSIDAELDSRDRESKVGR